MLSRVRVSFQCLYFLSLFINICVCYIAQCVQCSACTVHKHTHTHTQSCALDILVSVKTHLLPLTLMWTVCNNEAPLSTASPNQGQSGAELPFLSSMWNKSMSTCDMWIRRISVCSAEPWVHASEQQRDRWLFISCVGLQHHPETVTSWHDMTNWLLLLSV